MKILWFSDVLWDYNEYYRLVKTEEMTVFEKDLTPETIETNVPFYLMKNIVFAIIWQKLKFLNINRIVSFGGRFWAEGIRDSRKFSLTHKYLDS